MHTRPDNSPWPGQANLVPPELLRTREWLHEMFKEAGRGLPWPHQMSLLLVEQAILVGMFGGLVASAWSLAQLQQGQRSEPGAFDLNAFLGQLESSATVALPDQLLVAIRHVRGFLGENAVERTVGAVWNQMWNSGGPRVPFPPGPGR